jgi:tetratricopeptide (TPR) repeat protein
MRRLSLAFGLAVAAAFTWTSFSWAEDGPALLMERGQLRRAAALAEARIQARPDDAEALRILARIRVQQGRYDEATKLGERAVAAAPGSADAHYALAEVFGVRAQEASVIHKAGWAKRFKQEVEAALAIDPGHEDALEAMIGFHRQAPGIMGGDKKQGAALVERLVKAHPVAGWNQKAQQAFAAKDSATGEQCLRRAAAAEGQGGKLALAGYLAAPWRKPGEAERLAREVVAAESWRAGGWAILAVLEARAGRWTEVEATLARAEASTAGNLGAHYQAARIMLEEGHDAARAEQLFRRYLQVEPEIGAPPHAAAWWRLGMALERQGKKADAVAALQKSLALDPKFENAKRDLKRLKG